MKKKFVVKLLGQPKITEFMCEEKYWNIIENSYTHFFWNTEKFLNQLSELSLKDLVKFYLKSVELTERLYLPKVGAAADIMNREFAKRYGYHDDYLEFRHWIIIKGKKTYYNVLKNSDYLINHVIPDRDYIYRFEHFYFFMQLIFDRHTHRNMFDFVESHYVCQYEKKPLDSKVFSDQHLEIDFKLQECPNLFHLFQELL
jgi:hypothetical protein